MKQIKIDVKKIVAETRQINKELRENIPNVKISKSGRQEIIKELEETIALAESIKADINSDKAKRAQMKKLKVSNRVLEDLSLALAMKEVNRTDKVSETDIMNLLKFKLLNK